MPTYAALANLDGGKKQLMVVERIVRGGPIPDGEAADFVRDARCVAELDHPNIARIREVAIRSEDVIVASDFVDGERLSELLLVKAPLDAAARAADVPSALPRSGPQLDVSLRILVDVLTGLGALHNLRDAKRQPLKLVHGELWPANVVVGIDGTSRVVHACRVKSQAMRPGALGSGYLAPEVLLADGTADARADVYSAGAILWEMLSGKALFPNTNPHAIVAHLLSGKVARAQTPLDAPWAAELAIVAERALAADPKKRFGTAAEMVAEIRRVAGPKLATTGRVAMLVKSALGDKVSARRAQLEAMAGAPAPKAAPVASTTTTAARAQSAPQLTTPARAMPEVAQAAGEESFADIAWDVPIDEADPVFATNEKPSVAGAPVTPAPAHMPPK